MQQENWRSALAKTRQTALGRLASMLGATEINAEFWEQFEALLIQADVGVESTSWLLGELQDIAAHDGLTKGQDLYAYLKSILIQELRPTSQPNQNAKPLVILIVGVNGSGKTTAVARLAWKYLQGGNSVLLATADTYRAAAVEQLEAWGAQLDLEVISGPPGGDAGAVVYQAEETARSRGIDVLIADTSGRMHTSHNLMSELRKIYRVAGKVLEGSPHEVLLVLDATTGQNGLSQARSFTEAVPVTGVILTKLDSSARGGVLISVVKELGLPIRYVGIGEGLRDLIPFDPEAFASALISPRITND